MKIVYLKYKSSVTLLLALNLADMTLDEFGMSLELRLIFRKLFCVKWVMGKL
jgi:hypothetical protein